MKLTHIVLVKPTEVLKKKLEISCNLVQIHNTNVYVINIYCQALTFPVVVVVILT